MAGASWPRYREQLVPVLLELARCFQYTLAPLRIAHALNVWLYSERFWVMLQRLQQNSMKNSYLCLSLPSARAVLLVIGAPSQIKTGLQLRQSCSKALARREMPALREFAGRRTTEREDVRSY